MWVLRICYILPQRVDVAVLTGGGNDALDHRSLTEVERLLVCSPVLLRYNGPIRRVCAVLGEFHEGLQMCTTVGSDGESERRYIEGEGLQ